MKKVYFYKNFNMGRELDIAGSFIYRAIKKFDALKCFREECDIFHVLYDLSIGIERLQKILLVLFSGISDTSTPEEIKAFEKSIISHNHLGLHRKISDSICISFNSNQNAFLQMLQTFYKSCRYDRYILTGGYQRERDLLVNFLSERTGRQIIADGCMLESSNDDNLKRFFLKIVGSISRSYYRHIENQSVKLRMYTYKKRYDSAAYKLFLGDYKDDSFYYLIVNEKIALSEFLVYLLNHKSEEEIMKFIYKTPALNLDLNEIEICFNGLAKGNVPAALIDSIECAYEDLDSKKERVNLMLALHDQ